MQSHAIHDATSRLASFMPDTPALPELIAALSERGIDLSGANVRNGGYGDSEESSAMLIALIAARVKRCTSSLLWSWEFDGERLPREGDIEIVLDFRNRPVLLLRTTKVEIVPFEKVSGEFAAAEGEGDRSLECWRVEHWRFFGKECERIGRQPVASMPLVCETFDVIADLGR
ncbi:MULTISPECIES: ASCH domain-containing protein [Burkholderia]|uniref:ASCH domain-containing protein n=1 Tax=Burkholderia TaxID=32008 RepID=UPI000530F5DF|nr:MULTISPECIES: ASCH domain-containing protein [Burkholderia]KGR96408.1 ASCH domain protein [Burkholderia sp. ABCPW 111]